MNKYGHFEYHDYALGAKESSVIQSDEPLQEGSKLEHIETGVAPWEYSSLEQDAYVTRNPFELYFNQSDLGYLTKAISDENGRFDHPIIIDIQFGEYYSMTGITIKSRNIIKEIKITGLRNNDIVAEGSFFATEKEQFYPLNLELVSQILVEITQIDQPYHFLGIYDIVYGRTRIFDDTTNESAKITNNFSVLGDTIEYDTLDLTVNNPTGEEGYLFQRRQPIYFVKDGNRRFKFFVNSGDEHENNTADILAYDEISSLEDDFMGGMYKDKPFSELVAEILGNSASYRIDSEDVLLDGYIPICSKRKALQMILLAANLRCYKEDVLVLKPLEASEQEEILDQSNILSNPKKSKKQPLRSMKLKTHNYSKNSEEIELYRWYLSQTELTQINFSEPAHSVVAYEVVGVDENGNDVLDIVPSVNVGFNAMDVNYCIAHCSTSKKVAIFGKGFSDSTSSVTAKNEIIDPNQIYDDYEIETTIIGNAKDVCHSLFELYSRKNSIQFKTLVDVKPGCVYNILGSDYYIKKKKDTLEGLYEVEAI